jgi:pimeloyl-ACP methyl ester carboxylesterase
VLEEALLAGDTATSADPGVRVFRAKLDARGLDREALAAHLRAAHRSPIALDRITAPTLVLPGDADPFAARPEVLAAAIPGAELRVVPGDHATALSSPEFAAALLGFLAAGP